MPHPIDQFLDNDMLLLVSLMVLFLLIIFGAILFALRGALQRTYLARFHIWYEVKTTKGVLLKLPVSTIERDLCYVDREHGNLPLGGKAMYQFYHLRTPIRHWCEEQFGYTPKVVPMMIFGTSGPSNVEFKTQDDAFAFKMRWV